MTEAEAIAKRIESFGAGRAFTAADFSDVAGRRNAANALGRLHAKGGIARAIRGVYYVPECSALMGTEVPASADEVVRAVARANKWIVAPSGDAALNALGLDTQVPAKLVYVSSGPYKRYEYGPYDIELRHRANRDLLDCSQVTCTIVQALKALGRENVGDEEIRTLARNLTEGQVGAFLEESAGLTSWVADAAKKIGEAWTESLGPRPTSAGWSSRPPRRGWRLRRPSSRRTSGCATPWTTFSTEAASPSPWCTRAVRACRRLSGSSTAREPQYCSRRLARLAPSGRRRPKRIDFCATKPGSPPIRLPRPRLHFGRSAYLPASPPCRQPGQAARRFRRSARMRRCRTG